MSSDEKILPFPNHKAIEEQAALWAARIDSGELSTFERAELKRWVAKSAQHEAAFERMTAILDGSIMLNKLADLFEDSDTAHRHTRFKFTARWAVNAIAALLLIAAIPIALIWTAHLGYATQQATFSTLVGEQQTTRLVDGSKIILNTDSEVVVSITKGLRLIDLIRGESHFEVASERDRPFQVRVGKRVIKAVGTAFSVRRRQDKVEVIVEDGIVEVLSAPQAVSSSQNLTTRGRRQTDGWIRVAALTVGQAALFTKDDEQINKMDALALERRLAWRKGLLAFAGEPLAEVVEDIDRYTNLSIVIEDPDLNNTPIGGYFKVGDVEGLFEALETIFDVQVRYVEPNRVILSKNQVINTSNK